MPIQFPSPIEAGGPYPLLNIEELTISGASSALDNGTIADVDLFAVQDSATWSTTAMKKITFNHLYRGIQTALNNAAGASVILALTSYSTTPAHKAHIKLQRSNHDDLGTDGQSDANDAIGAVSAYGNTGSAFVMSSQILFESDADANGSSAPGRITFLTSDADDAGTLTSRLVIDDGGDITVQGSTTFTTTLLQVTGSTYFDAAQTYAVDSSGGSETVIINWILGNKAHLTITGTANTVNFTNPSGPCNVVLKVIQGDGSDTISGWDGDVKWPNGTAPTLSTGNGDIDIISFYFDGTNYFGAIAKDFA